MSAGPAPIDRQNFHLASPQITQQSHARTHDASQRNPLIYYRDNRSLRFTIAPLGSPLMQRLLDGETGRSADFDRDVVVPTDSGATPLQQRLRSLKARAREFA